MILNNTYYFLRHANTDRTQNLHFSEHPLSLEGHDQAKQIIKDLSQLNIDCIYSSPFIRAKQTVEPFSLEKSIDFSVIDNLCGRIVRELPKDKTWEFFEKSWLDFSYTEYNAETAYDCISRVEKLIDKLEVDHTDKNILLVSHSNPISLFLSTINKDIDFDWFKIMKCPSLYKVYSLAGEIKYDTIGLSV